MKNNSSQKKNNKKHNSFVKKIVFLFAMVIVGIIIVFLIDSYLLMSGKLRRHINIANHDVSGFSQKQFFDIVSDYKKDIYSKKIFLDIKNTEIIVLPENIGLSFNEKKLWEQAYKIGREKNFFQRFNYWISFSSKNKEIPLRSFVNKERYKSFVSTWEKDSHLKKPFEGGVSIEGMQVIVNLPTPGEGINSDENLDILIDAFLNKKTNSHIIVPLVDVSYKRDVKDLYNISRQIHNAIDTPILLKNEKIQDAKIELSVQDIIDILKVSIPADVNLKPSLGINDLVFAQKLITLKVKDAEFLVNNDYTVKIIPGRMGIDVNLFETKKNLLREFEKTKSSPFVFLSINNTNEQEINQQQANELGVKHVVSEFTTHHICCGARVDNIHKIADLLDGVIIRSGESFNVNTFIGERTKEKGFKEAGSIFEGKMITSIGGGISQFITTLHNAVYWGGYKIVQHKPHSIYFSRYPHGIEATIDWPSVHYIFKNDTPSAIVIDTEYTDTSITVRILGNNDGRVISGDHKSWNTPMKIIKQGGDSARRVVSHVDDAHDFVSPIISYISDSSVPRGVQLLSQLGKKGWHTLVKREIFIDESLYSLDVWPILYRSGKNTIYKVNPCDNPDEKEKPKNC